MPESKPIFCVVDPELSDGRGHYLYYDRSVAESAARAGYRSVILANQAFKGANIDDVEIIPTFKLGIWGSDLKWRKRGTDYARTHAGVRFAIDLFRQTRRLRLGRCSVVFGEVATGLQILGWAIFAFRYFLIPGPRIHVMLRYQPELCNIGPARVGFRVLERIASRARFEFVSDSHLLGRDYGRLTSLPVHTIPIPQRSPSPSSDETDKDAENRGQRTRTVRFVSLGNARDEKGILELLAAIDIYFDSNPDSDAEFVLHVYAPWPDHVAEEVSKAVARARDGIVFVDRMLDADEYNALLASADVVVLPYWVEVYRSRTSNPFSEALAMGKPVIVTANTWMASCIEDTGAGVICRDKDPAGIAAAISETRENLEEMSKAAQRLKPQWLAYHNPERLVDCLAKSDFECKSFHDVLELSGKEGVAAIVLPWPFDAVARSGAGTVFRYRINSLASRCKLVVVIEPYFGANSSRTFPRNVKTVTLPRERLIYRYLAMKLSRLLVWKENFFKPHDPVRSGHDLVTLFSFMNSYLHATEWRRRFEQIFAAQHVDTVFVEYPFLAGSVVPAARKAGIPTVLTSYDVISDQVASPGIRRIVAGYEKSAISGASHAVAVAEEDRRAFAEWGIDSRVIPLCVDLDRVAVPRDDDPRKVIFEKLGVRVPECPTALFLGSGYFPNVSAAHDLIQAADSQPRTSEGIFFLIAGGCASAGVGPFHAATGMFEEGVLGALYGVADVIVAPLEFGTGVSIKILEALALGKIIVGSEIAFRGIDVENGVHCIIENDVMRYPEIIKAILGDQKRNSALAEAAKELGNQYDYRGHVYGYYDYFSERTEGGRTPLSTDLRSSGRAGVESLTAGGSKPLGQKAESGVCKGIE